MRTKNPVEATADALLVARRAMTNAGDKYIKARDAVDAARATFNTARAAFYAACRQGRPTPMMPRKRRRTH